MGPGKEGPGRRSLVSKDLDPTEDTEALVTGGTCGNKTSRRSLSQGRVRKDLYFHP